MKRRKPRVYAVQMTHKWNGKELVPKFDMSSAAEYGELHFLLGPQARPFSPDSVLPELHEKLSEIQENDYLLLIGNPALIAFVACIAADYCDGELNLLQWSGKDAKYIPIKIDDVFASNLN